MSEVRVHVDPPDERAAPPKVSVLVTTYNHERYIAQSLDAILSQRAAFPFEVVVGEDCSSDGTRAIVREYRRRHPGVVRLVLPERNLGANVMYAATLNAVRGEHVATCNGDDYWVSPDKLARQSAFLDANPEFSVCFHGGTVVFDDRSLPPRPSIPDLGRTVFTLDDLIVADFLPAASVMIRRLCAADVPPDLWRLRYTDWVTWLVAARRGLVGLVEGLESVYRIHAGGLWSGGGREDQLLDELALYEALEPHFGNRAEALRLGALKCRVQLAVERCGVTHARPVALVGPRMVVPWYLNGRRVEHLTGTGADMIEEIERLRRSGAEPALPHWRSQTPAVEGDGLHVVVVEPDAQRVELRAHLAAFPCVWRDAACAIHRLPAAAPAEPLEVSAIWRAETSELVSAHLDLPKPGERTTDGGVQVAGWALGRQARVVSVALEVGNRVREARLGVPRPDLSAAFPGRPWAAEAGFHAWVPVDLGADRAIRVVAELADGSHVSLAVIHIQTPDGG